MGVSCSKQHISPWNNKPILSTDNRSDSQKNAKKGWAAKIRRVRKEIKLTMGANRGIFTSHPMTVCKTSMTNTKTGQKNLPLPLVWHWESGEEWGHLEAFDRGGEWSSIKGTVEAIGANQLEVLMVAIAEGLYTDVSLGHKFWSRRSGSKGRQR